MAKPSTVDRRGLYQEICKSHGAIADFRAKLLALLPAASGAGAFIAIREKGADGQPPGFLGPLGLFGFVAIFGLFMYELRGIEDCVALRKRAEEIERQLGIPHEESNFHRPRGRLRGLADEIGAGWIVYTAVMISWLYVAGVGFKLGERLEWMGWPWILGIVYLGVLVVALSPRSDVASRLAGTRQSSFDEGDEVLVRREERAVVKSVTRATRRATVRLESGVSDDVSLDRLKPLENGARLR